MNKVGICPQIFENMSCGNALSYYLDFFLCTFPCIKYILDKYTVMNEYFKVLKSITRRTEKERIAAVDGLC